MSDELIAYMEERRQRRNRILGWLLVIGLTMGGIAFFVSRESKQDQMNQRTDEVVGCMVNGDCD